jgi:transcriptional regulator with XRE-family HTH domain
MDAQTPSTTQVDPKELGRNLRQWRDAVGLTLRAVEEKTDGKVKNSYLSQIENGQISQPSPSILWELAQVYGVEYADLLVLAGHKVPQSNPTSNPGEIDGFPLRALEGLSDEDRRDLMSYVAFLRSRQKDT